MNKKLPSNSKFIIPMINLDEISSSALTTMIESAPRYDKRQFKDFIKNTIGAIHQIPHIFEKVNSDDRIDLKSIEAYFGRSSAASGEPGQNIVNRFKAHRDNIKRHHRFGMIIARTTIENTLLMERFGISLIDTLKKNDGLCIANKTGYSKGGIGQNEPGLLYMTFKIIEKNERPSKVLTNAQITSAVKSVMNELGLNIKEYEPVASAAKLAFDAANEVRFLGDQNINLYDPEKNRFLAADLSQVRYKSVTTF